MSIISFNIGLSLLSRNGFHSRHRHKTEARKVLSLLEGRPITDDDIARKEGGRPYFRQVSNNREQVDFNISHSGDMVAVSHVRGTVQEGTILRTGCDVELVKERVNTLRIAEQFFFPAEKEYILTQNRQGNDTAFFEIWTLKECYIKLHGLSVFDMTSAPDFVNTDGSLNFTLDNTSFFLYKLNNRNEEQYVLAAAVNRIPIIPSIHWFSESSLPCECLTK